MRWTVDSARAALLAAGLPALDAGVRVEPRDHVAIARLPGDLIAWFAEDAIGAARLRTERPAWPEPSRWIRDRLPRVVDDAPLHARIDALLDRYDAVAVDDADRVLIHGDLGLHNLAIDPASFHVHGLFDYGDAACADRHHDFRYLLFDDRDDALDAALEVYVPAVGRRISRERVALYHAVCAASFLAHRDGVGPEATWCGRTLAEDLAWTRAALRAGFISDEGEPPPS